MKKKTKKSVKKNTKKQNSVKNNEIIKTDENRFFKRARTKRSIIIILVLVVVIATILVLIKVNTNENTQNIDNNANSNSEAAVTSKPSTNTGTSKPSTNTGTSKPSTNTGTTKPKPAPTPKPVGSPCGKIDYNNVRTMLEKNEVIQEMPSKATLVLEFFNYWTGEREVEKSYIIKGNNVQIGQTSEYDIFLSLHSKYLCEINENNFCDIIKKAKANGDLGFYTELSDIKLAWKFKSMLEYKDCFGI